MDRLAKSFAKFSYVCARYPYEILVFYIVLSIGIWPIAERSSLISKLLLNDSTKSTEIDVLIVVAKCMSTMHIFYQVKKLKLIKSIWLFLAVSIIGLTICLNLSVISGLIASNIEENYRLVSTLPILLLVTELDFAHALFIMTIKARSTEESVPLSIEANMKILAPRAFMTTLLDLACMTFVIFGNSTFSHGQPDAGFRFAIKLSIVAIVFNFMLFLSFIPAVIRLLLFYLPRKPLWELANDRDMEYLTTRASQTLKLGSGFEMFTLISATFFLAQSRLVVSSVIKRFMPKVFVIFLREYVSPFYPSWDGFGKAGITTLLLVSIFRYLVLENVRNHRNRVIKIEYEDKDAKLNKKNVQEMEEDASLESSESEETDPRPLEELKSILKSDRCDLMNNLEIIELINAGCIRMHALEKVLKDPSRGVYLRRRMLNQPVLKHIKMDNYDYSNASKSCCENIIGYLQMPLGQVGPIKVDAIDVNPIMATTEGALLASVNRGCKLLTQSGGVKTHIFRDSMSRAPCLQFDTVSHMMETLEWIETHFDQLKAAFETTTRFGKLLGLRPYPTGRYLFLRVNASTGDAMGMNMVSKGTEMVMKMILEQFPSAKCVSLSGNVCTDKKPSAMNWIEGRGKSIIAECLIPEGTLKTILKVTPEQLERLNIQKNLIGSSVAGSVGGFNAHVANVVAACFLATGQDAAQVVEGSQTMTLLEKVELDGKVFLHASVTMKSLEVAARGGGTVLQPQNSILSHYLSNFEGQEPGDKAKRIASVIAGTVLAGELSLMAALCSGDLVKSHMKLNRIQKSMPSHPPESHPML